MAQKWPWASKTDTVPSGACGTAVPATPYRMALASDVHGHRTGLRWFFYLPGTGIDSEDHG